MENQTAGQPQHFSPQQQEVPNSTAVLVLGILSIVFCWCYGLVGAILGIIALVLSSKSVKLYRDNPSFYKEGSFKNLQAGKICAIIGVCLSGLVLIYMIFVLLIYGAALSSMPWEMMGRGY